MKASLNVHILTHRKEESIACKKCSRAFIRKDCLMRHIRKAHRDEADDLLNQHGLLDKEQDTNLNKENSQLNKMKYRLVQRKISDDKLCQAIRELLAYVVNQELLQGYGWPNKPVDLLLESLIKQCNHEPVKAEDYSFFDRLRENVKLLFTVVIEDESLKETLELKTVDEVIAEVIQEASEEAKFKAEQNWKKKTENDKSTKTKAELKAERRALQEAQRAAKSGKAEKSQQSPQTKLAEPHKSNSDVGNNENSILTDKRNVDEHKNKTAPDLAKQDSILSNKELPIKIFSHLPRRVSDLNKIAKNSVPPIVIRIGYQINKDLIEDPTARCVAMLIAFQEVIKQYQPVKDIKRELQRILFEDCEIFLNKCRPLSISMINAIMHLKMIFSRISSDLDDSLFRLKVCDAIHTFIEEEIMCSRDAISVEHALKLFAINSNESRTILTLGCSTIMQRIFLSAIEQKVQFSVIVVDTSPRFEGRRMVEFLTKHHIPTTYVLINAILYVMKNVNKVILEAHSVLCNGYVMSTIGSSQIALVAQAYNIPVIVCCETYKYSDQAYTDCFIQNELGANSMESFFGCSSNNANIYNNDHNIVANLNFLDLFYDLIPRELVSAVITEKGFLPCTSVPAILRFRETVR
ncbi:translation initiation factor eIF-2B subunit delta-like protein [Euroglyphus maynei]|uniref:Translation initiation factor eIF2B subunit delta n=1 Tax=Euroglyphus maynei TaxID=6958 RepID=A0A1Y3BU98_EURMA|nr:translation initiation factor eIF-2B subunit delta-like protein [Euroglyphus maynei]